ncbi:MAG: uroporphyrinogen decarboxylase [Thermoprotei archaeon]
MSAFLDACYGRKTQFTPVWFMRQAGRYLPGYRELRKQHNIVELIRDPTLAVEVTTEPILLAGFDAAIVFSDIVLPLQSMGVNVRLEEGVGPVFASPIDASGVETLSAGRPSDDLWFVPEQIRLFRAKNNLPIIGFSGAPFTLAAYMIEGGYRRGFEKTKAFIYLHWKEWDKLMRLLVQNISEYLNSQIKAGAGAVQLFDSWVGSLSPYDYERYVRPYNDILTQEVVGVPRIYFGTEMGGMIKSLSHSGFEVISLDWRTELPDGWSMLGRQKSIQGNLDPAALLGGKDYAVKETKRILDSVECSNGHIFNLGHGVLPSTDPSVVKEVVRFVHEYSRERRIKG